MMPQLQREQGSKRMQIEEPRAPITIMVKAHRGNPQGRLSNLHTRECFALLFGVEVIPNIEDGVGSHTLPAYIWTERIIFDILSPTIEDISQVMILNLMECLVF